MNSYEETISVALRMEADTKAILAIRESSLTEPVDKMHARVFFKQGYLQCCKEKHAEIEALKAEIDRLKKV